MTLAHLVACPTCSRHVRALEAACPFCKTPLGDETHASSRPVAPAQRLSRAALYALGVGSLSFATACGGAVSGSSGGGDADHDSATVGQDAAYGGSPPDGFIGQPVYGAPLDASFAPPYGRVPDDAGDDDADDGDDGGDAGLGDAATDASDAGSAPDTGFAVPYGLPPDPEKP